MKFSDIRTFIQTANAERLSAAGKDLFLYYWTCAGSGSWKVTDAKAAKDIGRSRSRVCEARNELIMSNWIAENTAGEIRITKEFNSKNVESSTFNSAENVESSTPGPADPAVVSVESSTPNVESSTPSVESSTVPYIGINTILKTTSNTIPTTSDDPPAVDQKPDLDFIFQDGREYLIKFGNKSDRDARSFLGKQRKKYSDAEVADAIRRAAELEPIEPTEFIVGVLKSFRNPAAFVGRAETVNCPPCSSTGFVDLAAIGGPGPCPECRPADYAYCLKTYGELRDKGTSKPGGPIVPPGKAVNNQDRGEYVV